MGHGWILWIKKEYTFREYRVTDYDKLTNNASYVHFNVD